MYKSFKIFTYHSIYILFAGRGRKGENNFEISEPLVQNRDTWKIHRWGQGCGDWGKGYHSNTPGQIMTNNS